MKRLSELRYRLGNKRSMLKFGLFALVLLLGMLFFRRVFLFFTFTLLTSLFTFFIYRLRLPFDVSPVMVMSFIMSRVYGALPAALFILLSGIIPMILAGGTFDHTTIIFLLLFIAADIIVAAMPAAPFTPLAMVTMVLITLIGALISIFTGTSPPKEIINAFVGFTVNSFYIMTAAPLLLAVLG